MDFEQVERQMFGTRIECLRDISLPAIERLPRQTGDLIKAHVLETHATKIGEGFQRVCGRVRAAEFSKLRVVESLCPKARPVDTQTPKRTQFLFVYTARIY